MKYPKFLDQEFGEDRDISTGASEHSPKNLTRIWSWLLNGRSIYVCPTVAIISSRTVTDILTLSLRRGQFRIFSSYSSANEP